MRPTPSQKHFALFALFAVLMAATRYHHFGSALHLPDASLAVFFLVGFYLRSFVYFPLLLVEAGLIDYLAITAGGVSDWCVTPAYGFLIPTYACLLYGGRWYAERHRTAWSTLPWLFGAVFIATSFAFLISNASFYTLSGRFPDLAWAEYGARVAKYYPSYLTSTFVYIAGGAVFQALFVLARPLAAWNEAPKERRDS